MTNPPHQPPGQPQYGPPPGYGYPPPPAKRSFVARHKILTALGVLVALGVVIALATSGGSSGGGGGEGSTAAPGSGGTTSAAAPAAAGLGTPVRDGDFEFTVTAVEPAVPSVGDAPLEQTAQGEYVVVRLTVANTGDSQGFFDPSSQTLLDAQGRQLSPDTLAGAYLDPQNQFAQINPGNSVQGALVFDVPVGTAVTTLELHDSAFSDGVEVTVG